MLRGRPRGFAELAAVVALTSVPSAATSWTGGVCELGLRLLSDSAVGQKPKVITGTVNHIYDGNTLSVVGEPVPITLSPSSLRIMDEKNGARSKERLHQLTHNKLISCEHLNVDKYGGIIARCTNADGDDIGAYMMEQNAIVQP